MPHLRAAGNRHPLQSVWQSLVRRELEGTVEQQQQQQESAEAFQQQQRQPYTEVSQQLSDPAAWDRAPTAVPPQQAHPAFHHPQAEGPSLPDGTGQGGVAGAYARVNEGYGEEEEEEFLQATPSQTGSDEARPDWQPGMIG